MQAFFHNSQTQRDITLDLGFSLAEQRGIKRSQLVNHLLLVRLGSLRGRGRLYQSLLLEVLSDQLELWGESHVSNLRL